MSHDHTHEHHHDDHHAPDGHHVSSQRMLLTVLGILLALTVITVIVAKYIPASDTAHMVMALIIACTKGSLVCMYFMHLYYDKLLYTALFVSCLFVMSLFFIFTMMDIGGRGQMDPIRAQLITPIPNNRVELARFDERERLGREIFLANCSVCHGQDGQGVTGLGEPLAGDEFVRTTSIEDLREFLIVGRPASHPLNITGVTMPARGGNPSITDEQLEQVAAYLKVMPVRSGGHGHAHDHHADDHAATPEAEPGNHGAASPDAEH